MATLDEHDLPHRDPVLVHLRGGGVVPVIESPRLQARRLVPFAAIWLAALPVPLLLPGGTDRAAWLAGAAALTVVTGVITLLAPWHRLPTAAQIVPCATFCAAVALFRHADAPGGTGFGSALILLPIVWQGIYGRRLLVGLSILVAAVTLAAPVVLLPGHPALEELSQGALLLAIGALVGGVLRSLVRSLRANQDVMARLAAASHDLHRSVDTRAALCRSVRALTGAPLAVLFEADGSQLVSSASSDGADGGDGAAWIGTDGSGPSHWARGRSFRTGEIVFENDADGPGAELGPHAVGARLHVPIGDPAAPTGVVSAAWPAGRTAPAKIVVAGLGLLGTDAAVALERSALLAELSRQAHRDGLTGLPNRRSWDDLLDRELARARRTGRPLSMALLDLDHFKAFNDRHGHLAGDDLLRTAAIVWKAQLRGGDVLARWGGEEFALLFPETSAAEAVTVMERLRRVTPEGQTFSAGVSEHHGSAEAYTLIASADVAMYRAKDRGRDLILRGA
jgi:diguanylate cyclase (GGDEF)-like protein